MFCLFLYLMNEFLEKLKKNYIFNINIIYLILNRFVVKNGKGLILKVMV